MKQNLKAKQEELWKLLLELNQYVGETEIELDSSLQNVVDKNSAPDWFNSGFVFTPLVLAYDHEIHEIEDDITEKQEELSELYKQYCQQKSKFSNSTNQEISKLNDSIKSLEKEINEQKINTNYSTENISSKDPNIKLISEKLAKLEETHSRLLEEIESIVMTTKEYLEEIEVSSNQYVVFCENLKANSEILEKYRSAAKQFRKLFDEASSSSSFLNDRYSDLNDSVSKLYNKRNSHQNEINELQEQLKTQQFFTKKLDKLNIEITQSTAHQEELINQLIDALTQTKVSESNGQKYAIEVSSLKNELTQIDKTLKQYKLYFSQMITEYESQAKEHFTSIENEYKKQIIELETEQSKLRFDINAKHNQIEMTQQQITDIESIVNVPNFTVTNSAKYFDEYRKAAEELFTKKNEILLNISKTNENIENLVLKSKSPNISNYKLEIQKLSHQISSEVSNLKEIQLNNQSIEENNKKLKDQIERYNQIQQISMNQILNEKDSKIYELTQNIENFTRESDSKINEIQNEIIQFQNITNNNMTKTKLSKTKFDISLKEQNENIKQKQKEFKHIQTIYLSNKDEIEKGEAILQQANNQIKMLRVHVNEIKLKEQKLIKNYEQINKQKIKLIGEVEQKQIKLMSVESQLEVEKKRFLQGKY